MRYNPYFLAAGAGLVLATTLVHARQAAPQRPEAVDARSADRVAPHVKRGATLSRRIATTAAGSVTVEDVGDVDSFGRNLRWLGVTQLDAALRSDCTGWTGPGTRPT